MILCRLGKQFWHACQKFFRKTPIYFRSLSKNDSRKTFFFQRKNSFFRAMLWKLRMQFWQLGKQNLPEGRTFLLSVGKCWQEKIFIKLLFLKNSFGYVEGIFDSPAKTFPTRRLIFFAQFPKNFRKHFSSKKNNFPQKNPIETQSTVLTFLPGKFRHNAKIVWQKAPKRLKKHFPKINILPRNDPMHTENAVSTALLESFCQNPNSLRSVSQSVWKNWVLKIRILQKISLES